MATASTQVVQPARAAVHVSKPARATTQISKPALAKPQISNVQAAWHGVQPHRANALGALTSLLRGSSLAVVTKSLREVVPELCRILEPNGEPRRPAGTRAPSQRARASIREVTPPRLVCGDQPRAGLDARRDTRVDNVERHEWPEAG